MGYPSGPYMPRSIVWKESNIRLVRTLRVINRLLPRIAILAGCLAVSASPVASAQVIVSRELRAITPEDIMGLTDVNDVEISPDGRHLVYVTQPTIATARASRSAIWIVATDGSAPARRLTEGDGRDGSPQWSPDGSTVAFLSNRPEAGARGAARSESPRGLWLISSTGGEAKPLTALTRDIRGFRWAPDGRSIAILAPDPLTSAVKADRAAKRDWVEVDTPRDPTRLWILDLASRRVKRIAVADMDISEVSWSPNGKRLAARVAAATGLNEYFYHSGLLVLDAATGEVERRLFKGVYGAGSWSPDSRRIAFTAPEASTIGIRVFVANVSSGAVKQLGASVEGTIRQVEWGGDNQTLLARAAVRTRDTLFSVDVPSGRFRPLVAFDGRIKNFSVAGNGSIALAGSQPDRAADAWVYRRGHLRLATDLNPQVRDWKLGSVEEVSWTSSRDGLKIHGVLVTPPAHDPRVPTKTVVIAHGGPHENWNTAWQGSWIDWAQMLASHGYVVLLPNPRGSSGQGTEFARGVVGKWGVGDYQDVADGADTLVARKIADPSRIGIGGWSYGGFMSAWAITHDTRFKTAIVGAGVTDLVGISVATDTPDWFAGYFGLPPASFAQLDALSPIRTVDRANGPVLVLHGQDDVRVPLTQGLGFHRGLRLAGREAMMVTYPREPHRIGEFEHQLDILRRVLAWYDSHL